MLPNELPSEHEPAQDPASTETDPAAPAIPQPTPNYATREDLMEVVNSVKAIAAAVQQGVATRAPSAPAIPDVTDDEIMASINEGKPTAALKRLTDTIKQSIIAEHVEPLRQQGMASLATLTKDAARVAADMPYFTKFEKQIDQLMASVPLAQRADPNTYRTAYAIVAGQNMPAIIKEEVEKAMRTAASGDGGTVGGGAPRPAGSTGAGVPSVSDLCGAEAEAALKANGWTPDQYAQKILRAKNWAEAATRLTKFNEEHPSNA